MDGEYSFEFYFYVEQIYPSLPVRDLYTFVCELGIDKYYLIKLDKGSSGYKKLIRITLPLFKSNFIFQLPFIASEVGKGLSSLKSIPDFKVFSEDINKEVLLVITKIRSITIKI